MGDLIKQLDYLKFVQYDREGNNIIRTFFNLSDMKDKEDKQLSLFEEEQKKSDIFLISNKTQEWQNNFILYLN